MLLERESVKCNCTQLVLHHPLFPAKSIIRNHDTIGTPTNKKCMHYITFFTVHDARFQIMEQTHQIM